MNDRQLNFDAVLLLMSGRVELQSRNRRDQRRASSRSDSSCPPGNDQTRFGATAQSSPFGVCFGPITITVRGSSMRLSTSAASLPEKTQPACGTIAAETDCFAVGMSPSIRSNSRPMPAASPG